MIFMIIFTMENITKNMINLSHKISIILNVINCMHKKLGMPLRKLMTDLLIIM